MPSLSCIIARPIYLCHVLYHFHERAYKVQTMKQPCLTTEIYCSTKVNNKDLPSLFSHDYPNTVQYMQLNCFAAIGSQVPKQYMQLAAACES